MFSVFSLCLSVRVCYVILTVESWGLVFHLEFQYEVGNKYITSEDERGYAYDKLILMKKAGNLENFGSKTAVGT